MSSIAFQLAMTLVRLWTSAYTAGLPAVVRDRRREEIASDLWEFEHDSERGGEMASTFRALARLILGIPDDLVWRVQQKTIQRIAVRSIVALTTIAVVVVILMDRALRPPALPTIQPAPPLDILTLHKRTPPVPPPPPPPKPGEKADPDYWVPISAQKSRTHANDGLAR